MCPICFSSTWTFFNPLIFPAPGSIFNSSSSGPNWRTCPNCSRKSSNVKESVRIFCSSSLAFSSSTVACAFSINVRTSPIPKIRDAIRSGWNASSASNFSPIPANLIGVFVTALIDSAAPPRVSPSNFVNTTPVKPSCSWKLWATLTASCPVIASTTRKISSGFATSLTCANSPISSSSICRRPAVSIRT